MVVSDVMTENPVSVESTESIRSVLAKLLDTDVRHIPVLEEGELVGIVSDRDFREIGRPLLMREQGTGNVAEELERPVSALMSADVLSVNPENELADVVDLLVEQRVGAVPVLDDAGDLVGIVSYVDVLRAARDLV